PCTAAPCPTRPAEALSSRFAPSERRPVKSPPTPHRSSHRRHSRSSPQRTVWCPFPRTPCWRKGEKKRLGQGRGAATNLPVCHARNGGGANAGCARAIFLHPSAAAPRQTLP